MKKISLFLVPFIVVAAAFTLVLFHQIRLRREAETEARLDFAAQTVHVAIEQLRYEIGERLAAFADATKADQMFSLRLLAENDPAAPEVVSRASEFIGPMGFSTLDLTDSAGTVVSSGSFPASAGTSIAKKLALLSGDPCFMVDELLGVPRPTLQAKASFTVADCITFHAAGGVVIDGALLSRLDPCAGVTVFLRYDTTVLGLQDARKISDVRNHRIIINDKEYPAVQLPLPAVEGKPEPAIVVVLMKRQQG
jgi:hypothetical protein